MDKPPYKPGDTVYVKSIAELTKGKLFIGRIDEGPNPSRMYGWTYEVRIIDAYEVGSKPGAPITVSPDRLSFMDKDEEFLRKLY